MEIGVELLRVLSFYILVKFVEVFKIGLLVSCGIIGLVDQNLLATKIEGSHDDRHFRPQGHVLKACLPFGDSFPGAFG